MGFKYNFVDRAGQRQELDLDVSAYREAADNGMRLGEYLNTQYPYDPAYGTTFDQCMASAGMFLTHDSEHGIHPPSMRQVFNGVQPMAAGQGIVRNDGTERHTPSGRLLFPEIVLQFVEDQLRGDEGQGFINQMNSTIATTQNVTSAIVDQPYINTDRPREARSMPIAQLAEPAIMMSITTSEKALKIPTKSLGMVISDEATRSTTLDLVGLALAAQATEELYERYEQDLNRMVVGDGGVNMAALPAVTAASFDPTITVAGEISHKAWVKMLYGGIRRIRTITHIFCDIDTALAIESRSGRPTVDTDAATDGRIDTVPRIDQLAPPPQVVITETPVLGANRMVMIDARYAIHRYVNVSASYDATEEWVMRRGTAMRFDSGMLMLRFYDQAWQVVDLTP